MVKMRTCKGRYWNNEQPGHFEEFENGIFHKWGSNFVEYEDGAASFSVAIVELPDGRVIMPNPDDIQFTGCVGFTE